MILGALKAIFLQTLNIDINLTFIKLELDKKIDQTAACFYLDFFYSNITQIRSTNSKQLMTLPEILEQRHIKLLKSSISKLKKRPAYIIAPWR